MQSFRKTKSSRKILIIAVLLVMAVSLIWFILPTTTENVLQKTTDLHISAEGLVAKLEQSSVDSLALDADNVVEITGVIREINQRNNRTTVILDGGQKEHPSVICDMMKDQKEILAGLSVNDTIVIKGIYKGFLKDAIILNCIVIHGQLD